MPHDLAERIRFRQVAVSTFSLTLLPSVVQDRLINLIAEVEVFRAEFVKQRSHGCNIPTALSKKQQTNGSDAGEIQRFGDAPSFALIKQHPIGV